MAFSGGFRYKPTTSSNFSTNCLSLESLVLLNQIRTVDKKRLVKRLGRLSSSKIEEVNQALRISIGLVTL